VTVEADGGGGRSIKRVDDLSGIVADLDSARLGAVAIDIPIGLPDEGSRRCDLEARKLIGLRRNSVFPAPFRSVLGALTYEDAATRCRAVSGKSLSLQAFGILPKIAEVDDLMSPDRQRHLVEIHPEVCFTVLAGAPMAQHKATLEGRAERLLALRGVFSAVDLDAQVRVRGTSPDDILDAFAAAWSATRWLSGRHVQLGGDIDSRGLRMEMIA
jgi:predicted RNase H-like nuclease